MAAYRRTFFLPNRTNGRGYAAVPCYVCLSSVIVRDVMYCGLWKRCVLEQKLILTAHIGNCV